jgi:hypothetical protein
VGTAVDTVAEILEETLGGREVGSDMDVLLRTEVGTKAGTLVGTDVGENVGAAAATKSGLNFCSQEQSQTPRPFASVVIWALSVG